MKSSLRFRAWLAALCAGVISLGAVAHAPVRPPRMPFVTGRFPQATRELLPRRVPFPKAVTSVSDRHGHRYRITPQALVVEAPSGRGYIIDGSNGLPVDQLTCIAMTPTGDVWLGSSRGAVRLSGGRLEYYASKRWLPDDHVDAIECGADGSALIYTRTGASRISFRPMTLAEKASHYERLTDARHDRFGYVTGCRLLAPGDLSRWKHNIDDNDGLWTAMYIAAESFRYAVTGSAEARRKASRSMKALLELERKSGSRGFPARAVAHKPEPEFGNHPEGEWHRTADGESEWKGDTSSDEIDGHYFAWAIYYDLVAGPTERKIIRETVKRVTDHIIDNGFYLIDVDGKPTRWGVWAPEKLNSDPEWRAERGLNSLELLAHLKAARHVTGDYKYDEVARKLISDHGYAINTVTQKVLPGDFTDAENNHSDDELAFLAYYSLVRYERDPQLQAVYLASLERSWQIERPEKSPLWNFIYGALTGRPCDVEAAVETLHEIPLDLVRWKIVNSHRLDVKRDPNVDRHGHGQLVAPLSWRERPLHKWNGNPYAVDGGNDAEEECGTFWLLPYWMGRYHGIIREAGLGTMLTRWPGSSVR